MTRRSMSALILWKILAPIRSPISTPAIPTHQEVRTVPVTNPWPARYTVIMVFPIRKYHWVMAMYSVLSFEHPMK